MLKFYTAVEKRFGVILLEKNMYTQQPSSTTLAYREENFRYMWIETKMFLAALFITLKTRYNPVFAYWSCHHKMPQAEWLKQQKRSFSLVGRVEVLDQDGGRGLCLGPLSLACRWLPSRCVLTGFFLYVRILVSP